MTTQSHSEGNAVLVGVYANYFEIGHTAFEFVLDFGQRYGTSVAPCHTRIVTTPVYAQAMLVALRDALHDYTAAFGAIDEGETDGLRRRLE